MAKKRTTRPKAASKNPSRRRAPARKGSSPRRSPAAAKKRAAPKKPPKPPVAVPGERLWVLDVPFEMRSMAQHGGAKLNAAVSAWTWAGRADRLLPAGLTPFESRPYSLERWWEDELNDDPISRPDQTRDGDGTMVPRDYQLEAVEAAFAAYRAGFGEFLFGDDVGLGKTIEVWETVRRSAAGTVLVLCPLSVVAAWRRTVLLMGDAGKRVVITNHDKWKRLLRKPDAALRMTDTKRGRRAANKKHSEFGVPVAEFGVIAVDESQKFRNPTSQRSKALRRIAGEGHGRAADGSWMLWMSATAGQNPIELNYLSRLLGKVTGSPVDTFDQFEEWCRDLGIGVKKGAYGRWEWDENPASRERDLALMHSLLYEPGDGGRPPAAIRRLPSQVRGWQEQQRFLHPIEMSPDERRLYQEAWTAFRKEMDLAARGGDAKMTAKLRFRQKCSLIRAPGTAAMTADMVENGRQVHVSVAFLETMDAISEQLEGMGVPVALVHGGVVGSERENEKVRFQSGEAKAVISLVVEGIDFHAGDHKVGGNDVPRVTLIHDMRYSGIEMLQIEGRCHRDGQAAPAYYLYGEDTVEEEVAERTLQRMKNTKTMSGDDVDPLDEALGRLNTAG